MIAVVILCTLTLIQISKIDNTPSWWTNLDNNPSITEQAGIELENRITSALTRVRPIGEEEWTAAIDQDQLNAWLAHRLRETLESFQNDSADSIGEVRIDIKQSGLTIGTKLNHDRGSTIVWAVIEPGTDGQGRFTVTTKRTFAGTSRIPTFLASNYLTSDRLGKARVDLGDGRVVNIRAIRTGDQRLELALSTQIGD
jgi:hypothetical protein